MSPLSRSGATRVIRLPRPGPWAKVGMALSLLVAMILGFVVYQNHRDHQQNSVIQALANGLGAEQRQAEAAGITPVAPPATDIIADPSTGASGSAAPTPSRVPTVTLTITSTSTTTSTATSGTVTVTSTTTAPAPPAATVTRPGATVTERQTVNGPTVTERETVPGPVVVVTETAPPVVLPPVTVTEPAQTVTQTVTETTTTSASTSASTDPPASPSDSETPTSPGTDVLEPQPSAPSGEPTGSP